MHPKEISIHEYTYQLPPERIAAFPLEERDASKLLVYKDGNITQTQYKEIAQHLPSGSLLVFNNTRVIQARILFTKPSGAVIEIFCLEPYQAINEYSIVLNTKQKLQWKCMIGGASKWKQGPLIKTVEWQNSTITLQANIVSKLSDAYVVELSWQPAALSFAEVLQHTGDMPLPPYIKRKAAQTDKQRYQTIYAKHEGSVAAPTAGLHFSSSIFNELAKKQIQQSFVTLHVGAGTFKPVKAASMQGHEMHAEWIEVDTATLQQLLQHATGHITAVGTTSLRTIESIYWMGVKALLNPLASPDDLLIKQWDVYEVPLSATAISATDALQALLQWMANHQQQRILATTQILICPGYQYKLAKAIVTNFHQPQSTLLLLVAAAVGQSWKKIYEYALQNDFRFLSYGDGSLLYINQPGTGV
jgi:S-adenosylmethionine:tRNA ribosyltransferase-isomerase